MDMGFSSFHVRTGGNGTAGMAMTVPVFEEEKWRCFEASQFSMAILEHEMSVQIGEGLTWALCIAVISGSSVQLLL